MKTTVRFSVLFACFMVFVNSAAAQTKRHGFVEYPLPGSSFRLLIEGDYTKGAKTVTLNPACKSTTLYFTAKDVTVHRVPSKKRQYTRMFTRAKADKDAQAAFEAAMWALKRALFTQFQASVDLALKLDPEHAGALRIMALKKEIDKPIAESPSAEDALRKLVTRTNMRIARSPHFIMLHDTETRLSRADKAKRRTTTRSKQRLDLLERVYKTFLFWFYANGVDLQVPKERLAVVLFKEEKDFNEYSISLSPALATAAGFWDHSTNTAFFYDNSTLPIFQLLRELSDEVQEEAEKAKKKRGSAAREKVRHAKTLEYLVQIEQEKMDITVVSHEGTHQMAGNTGLFPRHVMIPSWVHEGLATYFEDPGSGSWSGLGSVNADRLDLYKGLSDDQQHSNIDFIVGDQIFKFAASHGAKLYGYAQAWALTHFLMEKHMDKFTDYYGTLAQMPADVPLNPDVLTELFDQVFGAQRNELNLEWRAHMRQLRTDEEAVLGEGGAGNSGGAGRYKSRGKY